MMRRWRSVVVKRIFCYQPFSVLCTEFYSNINYLSFTCRLFLSLRLQFILLDTKRCLFQLFSCFFVFFFQDDKSDESDDDDDDDDDEDDDSEDEAMEEEEGEDEKMDEEPVDQNFRMELMKVLQQKNALVGGQAFQLVRSDFK